MTSKVREIMHPGLITCRGDAPLGEVAFLLYRQHIHALVVVDEDDQPIGILSDFDLLAAEWLAADVDSMRIMRNLTAQVLMSTPVHTIDADATASEAARRILEGEEHRFMVMDKDQPVGIVSISDVVASFARKQKIGRLTVEDVMTRTMLVCRARTPLPCVARGMTEAGFRSVLVLDAEGFPKGVLTGKDLLRYCQDDACVGMLAGEVAHPPITIAYDAALREAADKMIQHHVHRLIVMDPSKEDNIPIGIISSYDMVSEMAQPGSIWREHGEG